MGLLVRNCRCFRKLGMLCSSCRWSSYGICMGRRKCRSVYSFRVRLINITIYCGIIVSGRSRNRCSRCLSWLMVSISMSICSTGAFTINTSNFSFRYISLADLSPLLKYWLEHQLCMACIKKVNVSISFITYNICYIHSL